MSNLEYTVKGDTIIFDVSAKDFAKNQKDFVNFQQWVENGQGSFNQFKKGDNLDNVTKIKVMVDGFVIEDVSKPLPEDFGIVKAKNKDNSEKDKDKDKDNKDKDDNDKDSGDHSNSDITETVVNSEPQDETPVIPSTDGENYFTVEYTNEVPSNQVIDPIVIPVTPVVVPAFTPSTTQSTVTVAPITLNPVQLPNLFTDGDDNLSFGTNSLASVLTLTGVTCDVITSGTFNSGSQYNSGAGDDIVILPHSSETTAFVDGSDMHLGDGNDKAFGAYHHGVTVYGDAGDDTLYGSKLDGGTGNDILYLNNGDGDDYAHAGDGNDTVYVYVSGGTVTGGDGNDTIIGQASMIVDAGTGDDIVLGSRYNDSIVLGDGSDFARGLNGNDTFNGGAGADTLQGGNGNDTFIYRVGHDGADKVYGGDTSTDTGVDTLNLIFGSQAQLEASNEALTNVFSGDATQGYADLGFDSVTGVENVTVSLDDGTSIDVTAYSVA